MPNRPGIHITTDLGCDVTVKWALPPAELIEKASKMVYLGNLEIAEVDTSIMHRKLTYFESVEAKMPEKVPRMSRRDVILIEEYLKLIREELYMAVLKNTENGVDHRKMEYKFGEEVMRIEPSLGAGVDYKDDVEYTARRLNNAMSVRYEPSVAILCRNEQRIYSYSTLQRVAATIDYILSSDGCVILPDAIRELRCEDDRSHIITIEEDTIDLEGIVLDIEAGIRMVEIALKVARDVIKEHGKGRTSAAYEEDIKPHIETLEKTLEKFSAPALEHLTCSVHREMAKVFDTEVECARTSCISMRCFFKTLATLMHEAIKKDVEA